jgi:hypothetical protein
MSGRRVTSWLVPLAGHKFDLEDLPRWFAGEEVRVAPHEDGFALVIPTAVIGDGYDLVYSFAEERVRLVNGVGRLLNPKFRPVSLVSKVLGVDSAGTVCHMVIAAGAAEIRVKAGSVRVVRGTDVQPDPAEGLATPLMRAASRARRAHDALAIVGRQNLTWSELYLLFELVEAEVGGEMHRRGWISEADAGLFTHTANSYSALRSEGRHGKERGRPPSTPMQHAVAMQRVSALVLAWLNFVGDSDAQDSREAAC